MKIQLFVTLATAALAVAAPAQAEQGDFLVRTRAILVAPTEDSSGIKPAFPNDEVSVTNSFAPEVDFTYFVTDHFGLELIAATTKHDVKGKGGLEPVGELVDTWVLPPTLTLQYHFAPKAQVRPYVGLGLNYTHFYNEDASDALETAIGKTNVKLDDSFGYSLQAGVDVHIAKNLFLNVDVKYIDIDTEAKLTTGNLINRVNVSIDPVVVGVGLGMRF
ncbi:outer membrane beta-barrel protein [Sphingomonas sp. NSE70-1]|uniref:Outer membrane beta-barrel protein n=1 Tax=Sphingomonas caseinilyticus TaxID=2908205 RepID=A0ABT0RUH7_9SPHN|nr:OmpW family outer membrane protein [Sphingomonas caseinilyticus]MCL6698461.1 outer membrane beta-barrel protein [Sphingomonas caseinilyticus]